MCSSTFEQFHTDLEMVFLIYKPGLFWPSLYLQFFNSYLFLWNFRKLRLFLFAFVSSDVCISNFLYDQLVGSCLAQTLIGPDFSVHSSGTYFVPQKLLLIGCLSIGQCHLNMFPVYDMYIKYLLVLDEFSLWLRLPADFLGKLA